MNALLTSNHWSVKAIGCQITSNESEVDASAPCGPSPRQAECGVYYLKKLVCHFYGASFVVSQQV